MWSWLRAASSSRKTRCRRTAESSARISIASAPWPAAGHITFAGSTCRTHSRLPSRFSPAAARITRRTRRPQACADGYPRFRATDEYPDPAAAPSIAPAAAGCWCPPCARRQFVDAAEFERAENILRVLARGDRRNLKFRRFPWASLSDCAPRGPPASQRGPPQFPW